MSRRDDELRRQELELADALATLDETFAAMASGAGDGDDDVPDEVVAALMARPELLEPAGNEATAPPRTSVFFAWKEPVRGWLRAFLQVSAATPVGRTALAVAATALFAVTLAIVVPRADKETAVDGLAYPEIQSPRFQPPASPADSDFAPEAKTKEELRAMGYLGNESTELESHISATYGDVRDYNVPVDEMEEKLRQLEDLRDQLSQQRGDVSAGPPGRRAADKGEPASPSPDVVEDEITVTGEAPIVDVVKTVVGKTVSEDDRDNAGEDAPFYSFDAFEPMTDDGETATAGGVTLNKVTGKGADEWRGSGRFEADAEKPGADAFEVDVDEGAESGDVAFRDQKKDQATAGDGDAASETVRRFLAERERAGGHVLQEAAGYWRNPWVPGDPQLRFLAARLDELAPQLPGGLHRLATRPGLPLDPPERDALAVYLHADRTVTDGPTRVAVRVGVRAADGWAGRRTAMNLAVILHLPPADQEIPAETAAALRALLDALAAAHDVGDQFHLFVAGRPGGLLVPAQQFRRGALTVAAGQLLDGEAGTEAGSDAASAHDHPYRGRQKLEDMMWWARDEVAVGDDDERPVGSSAVLVVTLGDDVAALQRALRAAHRLAVDGVRVSALGVGQGATTGELPELLARIADAGQGSRRLVARPADAARAIEDELAQASRAVARAVRLRIRPAPGVGLIGVFDSERLAEPAAERVREAERALDRRLARKLGIEADRGDDEEGIQIVVPALYAGDAMTVLLDLVAPGPGPLVDVTVRYKDLVRVENGVARARLELAYGEPPELPAGPLEVSVVESLLAHEVETCLEQAARQLQADTDVASGAPTSRAVATLTACRDLLRGMARRVPALADSPAIVRDLAMLDGYLSALHAGPTSDVRAALVQSLRYAGLLKRLPAPVRPGDEEPRR